MVGERLMSITAISGTKLVLAVVIIVGQADENFGKPFAGVADVI
jgi:hypothetical protein